MDFLIYFIFFKPTLMMTDPRPTDIDIYLQVA